MKLAITYYPFLTLAIASTSITANALPFEPIRNLDIDPETTHASQRNFGYPVSASWLAEQKRGAWWRETESSQARNLATPITQALRKSRPSRPRYRTEQETLHRHHVHGLPDHEQPPHSCALMRIFNRLAQAFSSTNTVALDGKQNNVPQNTAISDQDKQYHICPSPSASYDSSSKTKSALLLDAFLFNPCNLMLVCVALVFILTALLGLVARMFAEGVRYEPHDVDDGGKRRGVGAEFGEDESDEGWREKTSVVV